MSSSEIRTRSVYRFCVIVVAILQKVRGYTQTCSGLVVLHRRVNISYHIKIEPKTDELLSLLPLVVQPRNGTLKMDDHSLRRNKVSR